MLTEMQVQWKYYFHLQYQKLGVIKSNGPTTGHIKILSFNDESEKCSVIFITLRVQY